MTQTITLKDGRTLTYADYGEAGQTSVLWCHGGPGSRLEPLGLAPMAQAAGLRLIGVDRPGYGGSTPKPGRSIGEWVDDGLALADHLALDRFYAVGVSTGGAYSLALAASSERVAGVVACCALTDMSWTEGKVMMDATADIWRAPSRQAAMAIAEETFGRDGSKMLTPVGGPALPPADMALMNDPAWLAGFSEAMKAMFAWGVEGYADDRLADGPGWGSFDVSNVKCQVTVLHGGADSIVPLAHAHHTASLVPGATLRVHDELGHFSIVGKVVDNVRQAQRTAT